MASGMAKFFSNMSLDLQVGAVAGLCAGFRVWSLIPFLWYTCGYDFLTAGLA